MRRQPPRQIQQTLRAPGSGIHFDTGAAAKPVTGVTRYEKFWKRLKNLSGESFRQATALTKQCRFLD
jgi:hypothetical protein